MVSTASFPAITDKDIEEEQKKRAPETYEFPNEASYGHSKTGKVFHQGKSKRENRPSQKAIKPGLVLPFSIFETPQQKDLDESFTHMMLRKLDEKGYVRDSDFYRGLGITRQTWSKMKEPGYHPKKTTAVAVALRLMLSLDETSELLVKAGYSLSHSIRFDVIIEFCILNQIYDIFQVNELLFYYDQPLLGE